MTQQTYLIGSFAILLTIAGCAESKPETPPAERAPAAAPAKPIGKSAQGQTFALEAISDNTYPQGEESRFSISIAGRDGWHINKEFPLRIELEAPNGVGLTKTAFERPDAAAFSDASARFDVPFKPSEAGRHEIRADVSFAMCTDENCVLEDQKLALALEVK